MHAGLNPTIIRRSSSPSMNVNDSAPLISSMSIRSPFDDPDADIVIRSAEGISFRLYKVILSKASSVFRDMFTLPDGQSHSGPQTVDVSEDADTLENLMRFCYPVSRPTFHSLDQLRPVISAAKKYDMQSTLEDLVRIFESILPGAPPLSAYTLACLLELPHSARTAAKQLLSDPHCFNPKVMPPEFRILPCTVLYTFAVYRSSCQEAALSVVDDWDWLLSGDHSRRMQYSNKGNPHLHSTWVWFSCKECSEDDDRGMWAGRKSGGDYLYPRRWWTRYIRRVRNVLVEFPSPEVAGEAGFRESAVKEAAACGTCASRALSDLNEFSQSLLLRIREAINSVRNCS